MVLTRRPGRTGKILGVRNPLSMRTHSTASRGWSPHPLRGVILAPEPVGVTQPSNKRNPSPRRDSTRRPGDRSGQALGADDAEEVEFLPRVGAYERQERSDAEVGLRG